MPKAALTALPSELIYAILRELGPQDLAIVSTTCKALHLHASHDRLWQHLVQQNVPGIDVASTRLPAPIASFRELFLAHHPHWFLPRHKIWISSEGMTGKLVIARYDPRRACIEGYQLLAVEHDKPSFLDSDIPRALARDLFGDDDGEFTVESDDDILDLLSGFDLVPGAEMSVVPAMPFSPDIHLHVDRPVFHLGSWLAETEEEEQSRREAEAGSRPRIRTGQQTGRWPVRSESRIRAPRWQQPPPTSSLSPEPPIQSDWVRPIPVGSGIGNVVNVQFLYARNLPPEEERCFGTFKLAPNMRARPPFCLPTIEAFMSNGRGPELPLIRQLTASQLLVLPPSGTSASRNHDRMHFPHPLYLVWPPPNVPTQIPGSRTLPARENRIRHISLGGATAADRPSYMRAEDHPASVAQMSDRGFYIRTRLNSFLAAFDDDTPPSGVTMAAFSTIDSYYYTPTADKPFRGIWVGDYGGHGCEFLLMHQPDDDEDEQRGADGEAIPQLEAESDEEYAQRRQDARIYRGRLEAIKLTGDPNVPRGEYSFYASDLRAGRLLKRGMFAGMRMLQTRGHVAGHGFQNDRYLTTRLIVVSNDTLAQFWSGRGDINYYHRVDIGKYTRPF